jgi:hypothetical protein
MKKIFSLMIFTVSASLMYSQVGIGTPSPVTSAVLDITSSNKGVMIPNVALTAVNSKAPLAGNLVDGTMVFNTATSGTGDNKVFPGVYIWSADKWNYPSELGLSKSKAVKFTSSSASTTNFNPATVASPVNIDIFSAQVFNDDSSVFEKVSNYELRVKQAGLYLISVNLALKQVPAVEESRVSDYIYLNLDGALASSKIITLVPQYDPAKVNINGRFAFGSNSYINAAAGQIITLQSARYKNGTDYNGVVNFDGTNLSSITIVKIQ